jgi:hypothetical protein
MNNIKVQDNLHQGPGLVSKNRCLRNGSGYNFIYFLSVQVVGESVFFEKEL